MSARSDPARGRPDAGRGPLPPPDTAGWRSLKDSGAVAGEDLGQRLRGAYQDVASGRAKRAAAQERQHGRALFSGTCRDHGRNATVLLYPDRVERVRSRGLGSLVGVTRGNEVTPVRSVTSVHVRKDNLLWSVVTVWASANAVTFRMSHTDARQFGDLLTKLVLRTSPDEVAPPRGPAPAVVPVPVRSSHAAGPDALDTLRRLAELKDLGVLSDEEFTRKKTELLKRV